MYDSATTRQVELRDRLLVQPVSWLREHQGLPSSEWRVIREHRLASEMQSSPPTIILQCGYTPDIHLIRSMTALTYSIEGTVQLRPQKLSNPSDSSGPRHSTSHPNDRFSVMEDA